MPANVPSTPPGGQPHQHPDQIWSELELQRAGDRVVLARFALPGLIVDEHMNVLQVRGQTSAYIELASGTVSWNLLRVVREGIAATVRDAADRSRIHRRREKQAGPDRGAAAFAASFQ